MIEQSHILIVDDDPDIRKVLEILLKEKYFVSQAADGPSAIDYIRANPQTDLVILDVMMPGMNGYDVCSEIRARDAEVPILFLTAKGGDAEEFRGLSLGADDFIVKTSSPRVLLARVARILQRAGGDRGEPEDGSFSFAGWQVDTVRFRLVSDDGPGPELSMREIELMRLLARHPGEVFSRDALFTQFWGVDFKGNESTLSVAISRLRNKLGAGADHLEAVWGRGYRYCEP